MKRRGILSIILTLLLCIGLIPTGVSAAGTSRVTICGSTWDTSTYAKAVGGQVVTEGAAAEDYNLY